MASTGPHQFVLLGQFVDGGAHGVLTLESHVLLYCVNVTQGNLLFTSLLTVGFFTQVYLWGELI